MLRWPTRLDVGVLVVVAVIGLTTVPLPLAGDQALFTVGARQIAQGDVLYRDFWDAKQPGIFLYYLAGGELFGYRAIGERTFDVLAMLGLGAVLQCSLRARLRNGWVASVAALLVVGVFFAGARHGDLGQVESVVGLPMYLALLWSVPDRNGTARPSRLLFLSGVAGGAVVLLKLFYLPIPGAFWLLAMVAAGRAAGPGRRWRSGARVAVPIAAGLALPVAATLLYFAITRQLGEVAYTYFGFTASTTGNVRPFSRLIETVTGDGLRFAPIIALAIAGVWLIGRRRSDPFIIGLLAWVVLAVPLLGTQHWFTYQFKLVLVPIGVLAAYGADELWSRRHDVDRSARVATVVALLVLLVPVSAILGRRMLPIARNDFALTTEGRQDITEHYEPTTVEGRAWVAQLREPGDVYVLGNPGVILLSGRDQGIRTNGWSPEQFTDRLWDRVADELDESRPRYLLIDDFSADLMRERAPETQRTIDDLYCVTGGSGDTTWYELRELASCSEVS